MMKYEDFQYEFVSFCQKESTAKTYISNLNGALSCFENPRTPIVSLLAKRIGEDKPDKLYRDFYRLISKIDIQIARPSMCAPVSIKTLRNYKSAIRAFLNFLDSVWCRYTEDVITVKQLVDDTSIPESKPFQKIIETASVITGHYVDDILDQIVNDCQAPWYIRFADGNGPCHRYGPDYRKLRKRLLRALAEWDAAPDTLCDEVLWSIYALLEILDSDGTYNSDEMACIKEAIARLPEILKPTVVDIIRKTENGIFKTVAGTYHHHRHLITIYRKSCKRMDVESLVFGHELFHAIHYVLRDRANPTYRDPNVQSFNGNIQKRKVVLESFATAFEIKLACSLGNIGYTAERIKELKETKISEFPYSGALDLIDPAGNFKSVGDMPDIQIMTDESLYDIDAAYNCVWN